MDSELSDQVIIAAVIAGDRDQFAILVRRYQNLIYSIIIKKVFDRSAAEEIAQDVFIRAYNGLAAFRSESSFSTWLIRIAINLAYNHRLSRTARQSRFTTTIDSVDHRSNDANPDQVLAHKQARAIFESCFQKLTSKLSEALLLAGLQGLSYEDAANVMGIPVGTVRSRLNQARLLISECMARSY